MSDWTVQEDLLLEHVCALRAELASMRRCFEAADRERSGLRDRAERAEAERDALQALLTTAGLARAQEEHNKVRAERDALRAALINLLPLAEFGAGEQSPPYADNELLEDARAALAKAMRDAK